MVGSRLYSVSSKGLGSSMKLKLLANVFRIDKYYMLVRKFVNASFLLLVREEWSSPVCGEYNHIIGGPGGPL